jgi:hypothetical protein
MTLSLRLDLTSSPEAGVCKQPCLHEPDSVWICSSHGSKGVPRGPGEVASVIGWRLHFVERVGLVQVVSAEHRQAESGLGAATHGFSGMF